MQGGAAYLGVELLEEVLDLLDSQRKQVELLADGLESVLHLD